MPNLLACAMLSSSSGLSDGCSYLEKDLAKIIFIIHKPLNLNGKNRSLRERWKTWKKINGRIKGGSVPGKYGNSTNDYHSKNTIVSFCLLRMIPSGRKHHCRFPCKCYKAEKKINGIKNWVGIPRKYHSRQMITIQ